MLIKKICCVLGFSLIMQSSYAGVGLETTRVIFNEGDKNQGVVAFNTDKTVSYLAQSWVENQHEKQSNDFVVMTPLLKVRPEQKNTVQLMKNVNLNADQESMYWLNVKFIAPNQKDADNTLKYAMTHRIKVLYRPSALSKMTMAEEAKKLTWNVQNGQLNLKNPTPFYIHLAEVKLAGQAITTPTYIAPYAQINQKVNAPAQTNVLHLSYINDHGRAMPIELSASS